MRYNNTEQTPDTDDKMGLSAQTSLANNVDIKSSKAETSQIPQSAIKTAPLHWSAWVCIVWLAGAACNGVVARVLNPAKIMRRRIRHTQTPVPKRISAVFDACKKELGIKRPVRLVMQTAMPVPASHRHHKAYADRSGQHDGYGSTRRCEASFCMS